MLENLHRRLADIEQTDAVVGAVYGAPGRRAAIDPPVARRAVFVCPVCDAGYARFLPFGLGGRRNAQCPGCGSLERHRFLWLYLRDRLHLDRRRLRIIHVAPERPIFKALARNHAARYISVDGFDPNADRIADLTALPFADHSFDIAICSHVLEHIEDDRAAMRELFRILRPGGHAVVMVPIDLKRPATYEDAAIATAAACNAAFGHPYHVRICGADYPDRLSDAGFEVRTVSSQTLSRHRRRLWRINKTPLFDCLKPVDAARLTNNGPAMNAGPVRLPEKALVRPRAA